jgi:MtN3 and saliva related transmembrane protein
MLPAAGTARGRGALVRRMDINTVVGSVAAFCTTVSYFPQLKKCWTTGSASDLSLKTFLILTSGVALWIVYGVLEKDSVIIAANGVSLCCLLAILFFKLREQWGAPQRA